MNRTVIFVSDHVEHGIFHKPPAGECATCGTPTFRDGHAPWCWTSRGEPYPWDAQTESVAS